MGNTIDFKNIKRDRKNKDLPKSYLEAESLINEIKIEYLKLLNGSSRNNSKYNELVTNFKLMENKLSMYLYGEMQERLNMSLLAIDSIFNNDENKRLRAKEDFQIQFEIINLMQMQNWEFKRDYEKEVKEELSERE